MGSGIFILPAQIGAAVGAWAPLAYLASAAVMGAIMLCFAEAAARVPTSGGVYGFTAVAFGPYAGWMAGVLTWVSNVVTSGAIAAAVADSFGGQVPGLAGPVARSAMIIGWYGLLLAVNAVSVRLAARFVTLATAIKLVPLLVFVVVGAFHMKGGNFAMALPSGHADIGRAAIAALFLFTGTEVGLCVAGEVKSPTRTIPRAVALALLTVAGFYTAIQIVTQGLLGPALAPMATAAAPAPLAAAMQTISPALGLMMIAGAAISMMGYLAGDATGSPRLLFAFARDGILPRVLGRLSPQGHTPLAAIACHCVIAIALALSGSYMALIIVATLVTVVVYVLGCAAALRLRAMGVEHAGPVTPVRGLWPAALVSFAAMGWVAAQSTREEALAIAALAAVASLIFLFRRQPALIAS
jgi:amino acid transporter